MNEEFHAAQSFFVLYSSFFTLNSSLKKVWTFTRDST